MLENWKNLGSAIDDSFFFVLDKIIRLESFFIKVAWNVAGAVLLIALLTAALKYLLTKEGFKESLITTMKAFVFFWIIVTAYPRVVGWIVNYAYDLAYGSVGGSVKSHFDAKLKTINKIVSSIDQEGTTYHSLPMQFYYRQKDLEIQQLFSQMTDSKDAVIDGKKAFSFSAVVPSIALQVMMVLAFESFEFADKASTENANVLKFPNFKNIATGLICGFFIMLTGIFALLEYLMCLLEFMFVTSIGVILLPLSIWEGSKFAAEGFIKAIIGFFFKLLLCTMAIFLLLYGFISMFHMLEGQGFSGSADQIAFILFSCLLFFYICKSAPGIAQSLITGSPSLSATGAISAATGAVAAAAAVGGALQKPAAAVATTGAKAKGAFSTVLKEGGTVGDAFKSAAGSVGKDIGGGLLNKSLGLKSGEMGRNVEIGNQRGMSLIQNNHKSLMNDMQESKMNQTSLGLDSTDPPAGNSAPSAASLGNSSGGVSAPPPAGGGANGSGGE